MISVSPRVGAPDPPRTRCRDDLSHYPWTAPRRTVSARKVVALVVLVLAAAGTTAASGVAGDGSCIACHAALPQDPAWQHSYQDWEESLHAHSNVDCHSCHGGDDRAAEAKQAHAGMAPVGGGATAQDRLTAARVCGSCHPDQYWGFSHSRHYQRLVAGELAAYCHTCHTSVGSRVLTPETIGTACRHCHREVAPGNIPEVATTLLTRLDRVRMALSFRDPDREITPQQWAAVTEATIGAMAAWHEFNLPAVGRALAQGTEGLER